MIAAQHRAAHPRHLAGKTDRFFHEAAHLEGDADMIPPRRTLPAAERRGRMEGRRVTEIAFRPDRGCEIGPNREASAHSGHPLVGRLRGHSELRSAIFWIEKRKARWTEEARADEP